MRTFVVIALFLVALPAWASDWKLILTPEGTIDAELEGWWTSRGYDWAVRFAPDETEMFDLSPVGCVSAVIEPAKFVRIVRRFKRAGEVVTFSDTPPLSTHYTFDRVAGKPAACEQALSASPTDTFRFFQTVLGESYAFFDLYGVDWPKRVAELEARVSDEMSEAELFELMRDAFDEIDDGHVEVHAEVGGEKQSWSPPATKRLGPALRAEFDDQRKVEGFGQYQTEWFFKQKKNLRRKALKRSAEDEIGRNLLWGRIDKKVGYIGIYGMGGFVDDDDWTMDEQVEAVHEVIGRVVESLADTEMLIFDITLNQGGYDEVGQAIAAHFADERTFVYTKQPFRAETAPQKIHIEPAEKRYLKPVILLTSELTVSAAETFTLAMRALPNVTHVGETTRGALSDILSKSLPNGWELNYSHEVYLDREGVLWEGKGIPPARELTIWKADSIERSQLDAILSLAREER